MLDRAFIDSNRMALYADSLVLRDDREASPGLQATAVCLDWLM